MSAFAQNTCELEAQGSPLFDLLMAPVQLGLLWVRALQRLPRAALHRGQRAALLFK